MRVIQFGVLGVFGVLLVGCAAWAFVWFATPPAPSSASEVTPAPQSVSATIQLNSEPQGAEATTSRGWSCRTPCSIKLPVEEPFTVTFTRRGFAPSIVPVQIDPAQPSASEAKFVPESVFAALEPLPGPRAKIAARQEPAISRAAPRTDVHDATLSNGVIYRGWKYLLQKTQEWGKLIRRDG
jgi:hypothetical protein